VKLFCQIVFPQQLSFTEKVAHETVLKKLSLTGKAELCQTEPYLNPGRAQSILAHLVNQTFSF
jgi:hypothetical protein